MNVMVVNELLNYKPVPGVTHADEAIGADIAMLSALADSTERVMLQPEKDLLVTFDGSNPAKAVVDPASAEHGFIRAAGVEFVLNREMALAMKYVCAVEGETGSIRVQELCR